MPRFTNAVSAPAAQVKAMVDLLPTGLHLSWRFSVFLTVLVPVVDAVLAYWLYAIIMLLQSGSFHFLHFHLGSQDIPLSMGIMVLLTVLRQVLELFLLNYSRQLSQKFFVFSSTSLVNKYLLEPWVVFTDDNRSHKIKHCTTTALDAAFSYNVILNLLGSLFTIAFLGLVIFIQSPVLAFSLLVLNLLMLAFSRRFLSPRVAEAARNHDQEQKEVYQKLQEFFDLKREITMYGVHQNFSEVLDKKIRSLSKIKTDLSILPQVPRVIIEILVAVAFATTVLIVSGGEAGSNQELIASMAAVLILARRILPALAQFLTSYSELPGAVANFEIIRSELKTPVHPGNEPAVMETDGDLLIMLDNISFAYPSSAALLRGVNLDVRQGDRLAIFGRTGKGKSTLMQIASGIIQPGSGQVLLAGRLKQEKARMTYVAQDVKLIAGTVFENVVFGHPKPDEGKVWRVLRAACLDQHIQQMPGSLFAQIGDNGVKFSGGQRQRLGIARALYFDPEVLFLDEATSAVDEATEMAIMKNIDEVMGSGAVVFITHRKSNADNFANRFIYL